MVAERFTKSNPLKKLSGTSVFLGGSALYLATRGADVWTTYQGFQTGRVKETDPLTGQIVDHYGLQGLLIKEGIIVGGYLGGAALTRLIARKFLYEKGHPIAAQLLDLTVTACIIGGSLTDIPAVVNNINVLRSL